MIQGVIWFAEIKGEGGLPKERGIEHFENSGGGDLKGGLKYSGGLEPRMKLWKNPLLLTVSYS